MNSGVYISERNKKRTKPFLQYDLKTTLSESGTPQERLL